MSCKWYRQSEDDGHGYESDCGFGFTFYDGEAIESPFKYCPKCGKLINPIESEKETE